MGELIHILGFSGSLRRQSYNTATLRAAKELLPRVTSLEIFDLSLIPLYNQDVERQGFPKSVQQFRDRIVAANALLIATPEYNYSISGVLKNAIDWASRPSGNAPIDRKPVAIMGASTGRFGTLRAQMHLRQICLHNSMSVVTSPQVLITRAREKFNDQRHLIHQETRDQIRALLEALVGLARRSASQSD